MPDDYGKRMPFDERIIFEIQGNPSMRSEQGPEWLQTWGGPSQYKVSAKLPIPERMTYYAVLQGHTIKTDIDTALADYGVTPGQVSAALAKLEKKGLVEVGEVTK